jgi:hypothetical protein
MRVRRMGVTRRGWWWAVVHRMMTLGSLGRKVLRVR